MHNDDIEGSRPKCYKPIQKSYSSLNNEDIVGSKPSVFFKLDKKSPKFPIQHSHSHRELQPDDSSCGLSFFGPKVVEPKFVRDNL